MNFFTITPPSAPDDNEDRDRKTQETKSIVDEFLAEIHTTIREIQETSKPERKDFPIASALRRSHQ